MITTTAAAIRQVTGINVLSCGQNRQECNAKAAYYCILKEQTNMILQAIADTTAVDHATVMHHIKVTNGLPLSDVRHRIIQAAKWILDGGDIGEVELYPSKPKHVNPKAVTPELIAKIMSYPEPHGFEAHYAIGVEVGRSAEAVRKIIQKHKAGEGCR